jgi:hypothetical protein
MTHCADTNESYHLAEEWVRSQIDDALHDEPVMDGSEIEAAELHQCDCVPVDLRDSRGRRWRLKSVGWSGSLTRLELDPARWHVDGDLRVHRNRRLA